MMVLKHVFVQLKDVKHRAIYNAMGSKIKNKEQKLKIQKTNFFILYANNANIKMEKRIKKKQLNALFVINKRE